MSQYCPYSSSCIPRNSFSLLLLGGRHPLGLQGHRCLLPNRPSPSMIRFFFEGSAGVVLQEVVRDGPDGVPGGGPGQNVNDVLLMTAEALLTTIQHTT